MDESQPGLLAQIKSAKAEMKSAEKAYQQAISDAEARLQTAKAQYDSGVEEAKRGIELAKEPLIGEQMTCGGVRLFGDRIEYENKSIVLDDSLDFDISGNLNSSDKNKPAASRIFLSISSAADSVVAELAGVEERSVRELVARAKQLSKTVEARREACSSGAVEAEETLQRVIGDTADVDAALNALESAKKNTAERDAAREAYELLVANADKDQLKAEKKAETVQTFFRLYPLVGGCFGFFLALNGFSLWTTAPQSVLGGLLSLLVADALITSAVMIFRDGRAGSIGEEKSNER